MGEWGIEVSLLRELVGDLNTCLKKMVKSKGIYRSLISVGSFMFCL